MVGIGEVTLAILLFSISLFCFFSAIFVAFEAGTESILSLIQGLRYKRTIESLHGDLRVREGFLILPKTLKVPFVGPTKNIRERRWLVSAKILQVFDTDTYRFRGFWRDQCWFDYDSMEEYRVAYEAWATQVPKVDIGGLREQLTGRLEAEQWQG